MFSIDFESPRFKSALRTLQYVFLTVFVVAGTIILVYAGQGYDINRRTGEVIQNGLLLVNTVPAEGAVVYINDQAETDLTPSRFPLPQGAYDIRLEQPGYLPWEKRVTVAGSAVEWLYYPRLIPEELLTENVSALRNVEFVGQSGDRQSFLVRQKSSSLNFNLFTVSDSALTNDQPLTLPAGLLELRRSGGGIGSFAFEGWAADNRTALLQHTVGRQVEYVLFDTETPAESVNLSREFDLDLRDVRFINGQPNQLYTLVNQDLRRLNLDNDTISAPIVRSVERYVLYEDRFIVFLQTDEEIGLQLGMIQNGSEPTILKNLDGAAGDYRLEFAAYDDDYYLALLEINQGSLTIITDPHTVIGSDDSTQLAQTTIQTEGARYLSISRNGQYVLAQGGGNFYSYDFDRDRRHSFSPSFNLPQNYEAEWIDGNYLLAHDRNDKLHIFEFDGGNERALVVANPRFKAFVDSDFETLYTFTPGKNGRIFMQSTSLIAENTP